MADDLAQAVMAFVAAELGIKPERLRLEARLLHDLGCDGDDASEFIRHFTERFAVDASGFQFRRHLGPKPRSTR